MDETTKTPAPAPAKPDTDSPAGAFSMAPLRAIFELTGVEIAILLVLHFVKLWRKSWHPKSLGLKGVQAILCTPDPLTVDPDLPADQALGAAKDRFSPRDVERGWARLKKRGWAKSSKAFQGVLQFQTAVPVMTWDQADEVLYNSAILAELGFTKSPDWRTNSATVAGSNIKEIDKSERVNQGAAAPAAGAAPKKTNPDARLFPLRKALLDAFKQAWSTSYKGETYIEGPGDGKKALELVRQGITADQVGPRFSAWRRQNKTFAIENRFPFWLFCRDWSSIEVRPADAVEGILGQVKRDAFNPTGSSRGPESPNL